MMIRFYLKDAPTFPVVLAEEDVRQGKLIPLTNGDLIRVDLIDEQIQVSVVFSSTSTGVLYGIEKNGTWIDQAVEVSAGTKNPAGATGDWVNGLGQKEAEMHANGASALIVGAIGEKVVFSFKGYGEKPVFTCQLRMTPDTMTLKAGEMGSFYVYDGMTENDTQTYEVSEGAVIIEQGNAKLIVGAKKPGSLIDVKVTRTYADGRSCVGNARLIIEGEQIVEEAEQPAPAEPYEPPVVVPEEVVFEIAHDVEEVNAIIEPMYTVVTHRRRGMRESDKLRKHILSGQADIEKIDALSGHVEQTLEEMRSEYQQGKNGGPTLTVEKSGTWKIEKRPYQGFVRLPCFGCEKIVSKSVKLNNKLLDVQQGHIEDYGILILTGEALKVGGILEVKATWNETIDNGSFMGAQALQARGQNILRDVHRIIGGE